MSTPELPAERARSALILVDIQHDFLPGGALAVPDGDAILAPVRRLLEQDAFGLAVATQDWHPPDHVSFASRHRGRAVLETVEVHGHPQVLWPDHCVQGSRGAELHPAIPWERVSAVLRKGAERDVDSYSGFRNNWDAAGERPPTGLAGYLRERGVERVVLCGLARDYCVKWSAEDAAAAGFRATVLWELTRPVDPGSDARVRAELTRAGVEVR
ncbi:MAG TPA: bifunctional nicotinamidase/pyrazinamidase [Gemmatimonadaceae bacterium]|nr:bifunctional nicotinamidase/pyrazinamidase [Gemmatimonadaceae bacterium]